MPKILAENNITDFELLHLSIVGVWSQAKRDYQESLLNEKKLKENSNQNINTNNINKETDTTNKSPHSHVNYNNFYIFLNNNN